jgi:hypothetical protein
MQKRLFFIWFICLGMFGNAPTLLAQSVQVSKSAQISLITGLPGQDVYNLFGHSGLRVYDPSIGLDIMYSYGTFDFDDPDFLLKFTQGKLKYFLSVSQYQPFIAFYKREGRTVYEQVLTLDDAQKQALFSFLQTNFKPENRYYLYDFFYDNCSTRIRDALKTTFGEDLKYVTDKFPENQSFRKWVDPYITKPWIRFGIYLLLGSPADKVAAPYDYMFLPDNLMDGFEKAQIKQGDKFVTLAPKANLVSQSLISAPPYPWFNPYSLMWGVSAILLVITILGYRKKKIAYGLDFALFFLMGLVGLLFLFMWFGTNHQTCAWNYNLIWALPTHAVIAWTLLFAKDKKWVKIYFNVVVFINLILVSSWLLLPQEMHGALPPFVLILALRASRIANKRDEL